MHEYRAVHSGFFGDITAPCGLPFHRRYALGAALRWNAWWLRHGGPTRIGRLMTRLARLYPLPYDPYYARHAIARLAPRGYFSPRARFEFQTLTTGDHVYIGDGVFVHEEATGGAITLGAGVVVEDGCDLCAGNGAAIRIGRETYLGGKTAISASVSDIQIGNGVLIAGSCGLFSYNHGTAAERPIRTQPLVSNGPIIVGDDVWIGRDVTVLSGVTIARGAVIGAGSVVKDDIPPYSIAVGVPARVVASRGTPPPAYGVESRTPARPPWRKPTRDRR